VDFAFAIGKVPLLPRPIHLQKGPSHGATIDSSRRAGLQDSAPRTSRMQIGVIVPEHGRQEYWRGGGLPRAAFQPRTGRPSRQVPVPACFQVWRRSAANEEAM
jgi:hypothetical protein